MQRIALFTAALMLPFTVHSENQSDFSGTWKMDASRSESAHQAVPIGLVTLVIRQAAGQISIETRRHQNNKREIAIERLIYNTDGSESEVTGFSGEPVKTKAHWNGAKLVTETARNVEDSTVTTMSVLSLGVSGREMTVDMTLTIQHGYQFSGAKNSSTGRDVFIRTKKR